MNDFEGAFGDFIDQEEYDQAEDALFNLIRASFKAGWVAAGGGEPMPQENYELIRTNKVIPLKSYIKK